MRVQLGFTWTGWLIVVTGKKLLNLNPEKKKGNWVTNIPDILMMIIPLSLILATLVASPSARHELLIQAQNCDPTSAMPKKTCNQLVLCYLSLDWRNTRAGPQLHSGHWNTTRKYCNINITLLPSPKSHMHLFLQIISFKPLKNMSLWWASGGIQQIGGFATCGLCCKTSKSQN